MAMVRWQISSVFRALLTQKDGKLNLQFLNFGKQNKIKNTLKKVYCKIICKSLFYSMSDSYSN